MSTPLTQTLLDESRKPAVIADVHALIDAEVSEKKGASGLALRGGYAMAKKVSPTIVAEAVEKLTPRLFDRLEPYWAEFAAAGNGRFGEFLATREDEVSEALLAVVDERVAQSSREAAKKVYSSMRGSAKKHVAEALPRVGELVQKHMA